LVPDLNARSRGFRRVEAAISSNWACLARVRGARRCAGERNLRAQRDQREATADIGSRQSSSACTGR
jgi:hypothetical protein